MSSCQSWQNTLSSNNVHICGSLGKDANLQCGKDYVNIDHTSNTDNWQPAQTPTIKDDIEGNDKQVQQELKGERKELILVIAPHITDYCLSTCHMASRPPSVSMKLSSWACTTSKTNLLDPITWSPPWVVSRPCWSSACSRQGEKAPLRVHPRTVNILFTNSREIFMNVRSSSWITGRLILQVEFSFLWLRSKLHFINVLLFVASTSTSTHIVCSCTLRHVGNSGSKSLVSVATLPPVIHGLANSSSTQHTRLAVE